MLMNFEGQGTSGTAAYAHMSGASNGRQEAAHFSVKSQLVFSALWAINTIPVMTIQFSCCAEVPIDNT